ncbi:hypothetical protein [Streptomyces apocyni]|uniref:hypothetical protein n=1 Tax=Streptomyces apocyni TaxID=2654677 RepID=UPI0012E99BA8|nr:hypothetical protein [Streptomyces apocyni]
MAGEDKSAVPDTGQSFDTFYGVNPQQALKVEAKAMAGFKKRVDDLLKELTGSDAAPGKMSGERMTRSHLGSPDFREAQFLYETFNVVHTELEKLSKALGAQIEGMGLAVHASQKGYDGIDQATRDRMKAINAEVEKYYDPGRDPYAELPAAQPADAGNKDVSKETGF